MFDPARMLEKAKTSKRYLALLNFGLFRMIPFNKPHGIKIVEIKDRSVKTIFPYKKSNFNHIKGLHACGLATVSEFTTGIVLLSSLDSKKYRIIMQKMEMNYHYQGKMDSYAEFSITDEWLKNEVINPIAANDSVVVNCEVKVTDSAGHHLTTGNIYWQVKSWSKVKTKA
ncbi:MAG: acyl-coenzyme A thioesterase PaaI-like protein [Roseivirga sp.]|jgi:acyl-coenzyme A thioesterase PaaI-like protein